MYEKMIAVTNRHLIRESNENEKINAGTDWSEAYIKQLAYVASLHPKAMVLREKDLTEEKYEELAKAVIRLCEKEGTNMPVQKAYPDFLFLYLRLGSLKAYIYPGPFHQYVFQSIHFPLLFPFWQ